MDDKLQARIRRLMDDTSTLADESRFVAHYYRRRLLPPHLARPTMRPMQTSDSRHSAESWVQSNKTE